MCAGRLSPRVWFIVWVDLECMSPMADLIEGGSVSEKGICIPKFIVQGLWGWERGIRLAEKRQHKCAGLMLVELVKGRHRWRHARDWPQPT